ncbi:MAG: ribosome silencing factor [Firmicutes bacterium]|nr:ribosome silencing factor [Bacillota bacterium]
MTIKDYALLAGKTLSDKKAQDIVIIDIQEKASFADYFVIASGGSERQVNALVDDVEDAFAKEGLFVKSIEGKQNSGWILMDFGDIIVNVFTKEQREKYNIEKVWGDCQFIEVEE